MSDFKRKITDWYLPRENAIDGYLYIDGNSHNIKQADGEIMELAQILCDNCNEIFEEKKSDDFKLHYKENKNDLRFRVHLIRGVDGDIFALRHIPKEIIKADDLRLPPLVKSVLQSPALAKGGLIIVSGETGQGKTTTCSSMIVDRLKKYGNFALTIEDPPEYYLNGTYGDKKGRCVQTEVGSGEFASALKGAMRSYPAQNGSILYIGETRDSETASEIIKAVTNGHIVFTTLHGMNVMSTLTRFVSMCSGQNLSEDEVRQVIAMSLRLVVHQRLIRYPSSNGETKISVECESLFSDGPSSPVANKIISSNIRSLKDEIDDQSNKVFKLGVSSVIGKWESSNK